MRPKGCLRGIGQFLLLVLLLGGTVLLGRAAIQGIVDLRTRLNAQQLQAQEIVVFPQTATAIGMLQPTVIFQRTLWQSPTPKPTATDDTSINGDTSASGTATLAATESTNLSGTAPVSDTPLPRAAAIATNTPPGRPAATQVATQAQVLLQPITPIAGQVVTQAATKNAPATQAATQAVALLASATQKVTQTVTETATLKATQAATQKGTQTASQTATQTASQVPGVTKPATSTLTATLTRTAARTAISSSTATLTPSRTPTTRKTITHVPTATIAPTATRTGAPSNTPTAIPSATATATPSITLTSVELSANITPSNTTSAAASSTAITSTEIVPTVIFAFPTVTDTPIGMQETPRSTGFVDPSTLLGALNTPNPVEIVPPTKVVTPGNPSTVCAASNARISSPATGTTLRGIVNIIGSANTPSFGYYKLEIRASRSTTWEPVNQSDVPVTNDLLGTIDTSLIQPGYYWLQLTVFDLTGANAVTPCAILVRVLP